MPPVIKIAAACLVLAVSVAARAANYSGRDLYMFGDSPASQGRGATGVSLRGIDTFYLNPASIAELERAAFSFHYGSLPLQISGRNIGSYFAYPTSFAVYGVGLRTFQIDRPSDWKGGIALNLGAAKEISQRFMLGLSFNFFRGVTSNDLRAMNFPGAGSLIFTGGQFGFIYKFVGSHKSGGFGFFEPALGFSVGFGYPSGSNRGYADYNGVTLGYNFKFFRMKNLSLGFFNDATAINYKHFPVKAGLEIELFDLLVLRSGFIMPNEYRYGSATGGLGIKFNTDNFKGSLNYSFSYYKTGRFMHYAGLTTEFGLLDRTPPDTAIVPDYKYISPNHDGVQDYTKFHIHVLDSSRIKGWKLQILDMNSSVVKEFRISDIEYVRSISAGEFLSRLVQNRETIVVPSIILWDGGGRSGKTMPDGKYEYSFTAWDARDNLSVARTGVIVIDNTPPEIKLQVEEKTFSPNGDRKKDLLQFRQVFKCEPDDEWSAEFLNAQGQAVKGYKWKGLQIPQRMSWDGRDDHGNEAPEGLYGYRITGRDRAGNRASAEIREISLTRQFDTADLNLSQEYYSNKVDKNKNISLFPVLPRTQGLEGWRVIVRDAKRKVIRQFDGGAQLSRVIEWDVRDSQKRELDDGEYFIKFSAEFKNGNAPESFEKKLIVDSTPPRVKIWHNPDPFTPDGDGENDLLKINSRSYDQNGIKEWRIKIIEPSGKTFISYEGTGSAPPEIIWDGRGEDHLIVESAARYNIELEAWDHAGNYSRSRRDKLDVGILVQIMEKGLRIRISNVDFPANSDQISGRGKGILRRVAGILNKYYAYNVIVEGHTDDVGREDYNLELSERRARSVMEYLGRKGVDSGRLKFTGMGETVPLYTNTSEENRRRNRRIEFYLYRKEGGR